MSNYILELMTLFLHLFCQAIHNVYNCNKILKIIYQKSNGRDYDGKVTPEEVASAAMYLKDTLDKEGIQELISNLSKDRGSSHHFTSSFCFLDVLLHEFMFCTCANMPIYLVGKIYGNAIKCSNQVAFSSRYYRSLIRQHHFKNEAKRLQSVNYIVQLSV